MTTDVNDLLVEIGTEELPPKALRTLSEVLATELAVELDSAGLIQRRPGALRHPAAACDPRPGRARHAARPRGRAARSAARPCLRRERQADEGGSRLRAIGRGRRGSAGADRDR